MREKEEQKRKGSAEGWATDRKPCKNGVSVKGLQLKPRGIKGQSPSKGNDMGYR